MPQLIPLLLLDNDTCNNITVACYNTYTRFLSSYCSKKL